MVYGLGWVRIDRPPNIELTDISAAVIPTFPFEPTLHINYQETVLSIKGGLANMKDLPKEAGGSVNLWAESFMPSSTTHRSFS